MVYFLNTNLNKKKKVYIALTKIYGLGKYQCSQICDELGISSEKRIKQLTQIIENHKDLISFLLKNL